MPVIVLSMVLYVLQIRNAEKSSEFIFVTTLTFYLNHVAERTVHQQLSRQLLTTFFWQDKFQYPRLTFWFNPFFIVSFKNVFDLIQVICNEIDALLLPLHQNPFWNDKPWKSELDKLEYFPSILNSIILGTFCHFKWPT